MPKYRAMVTYSTKSGDGVGVLKVSSDFANDSDARGLLWTVKNAVYESNLAPISARLHRKVLVFWRDVTFQADRID